MRIYVHSRCLKQQVVDIWGTDMFTLGCLCIVMFTGGCNVMWLYREDRGKTRRSVCGEGWQAVNELTLNTNTHTQILACLRLLETVKYSVCVCVFPFMIVTLLKCYGNTVTYKFWWGQFKVIIKFINCSLAHRYTQYWNIKHACPQILLIIKELTPGFSHTIYTADLSDLSSCTKCERDDTKCIHAISSSCWSKECKFLKKWTEVSRHNNEKKDTLVLHKKQ